MALLPLVEMGTAPPIAPGYDMLRPMNRFTRRLVELDNCSCPMAEHSRAMALIELSCACKSTNCVIMAYCVHKAVLNTQCCLSGCPRGLQQTPSHCSAKGSVELAMCEHTLEQEHSNSNKFSDNLSFFDPICRTNCN